MIKKIYEKMKTLKKSILLLMLATLVLPVWGEPVNEKMARRVASQTLSRSFATDNADNTTQLRAEAVSEKTLQLIYKSSSNDEENTALRAGKTHANETVYFYVFGAADNEGFVVVAADDRITPVLGYSHTNSFSADDMPPNLKWWLGEYAKQIQFAIDNDIEPTADVTQQWEQYLGN